MKTAGGNWRGQSSKRFSVIVRGLQQHCIDVSRRKFLGGFIPAASLLALGGCASVEAAGTHLDASALAVDPTLIVATTRKPVNGGHAKPWFGTERASTMSI